MKGAMIKEKIENLISSNTPIPICAVNSSGKIIGANSKIEDVFIYGNIEDSDVFALTGIKVKELFSKKKNSSEPIIIDRNEKKFKVVPGEVINDEEEDVILLYFYDVTGFEDLKAKYEGEKICVCRINIDNYDQFNDAVSPETGMAITTEVNKMIRKWAQDIEGSIDKIKDSQ